MIVLPIPVPIFVPVPMHLYCQKVPVPFTMPIPVSVPALPAGDLFHLSRLEATTPTPSLSLAVHLMC